MAAPVTHTISPRPSIKGFSSGQGELTELPLPVPTSTPGQRAHQRSRTVADLPPLFTQDAPKLSPRNSAFFPFLKNARDRSISPKRVSPKEAAEFVIDARNSRDSSGTYTPGNKSTKLSTWFNGTSDPVNITLILSPTKEKEEPFSGSTEMWRATSGTMSTESLTQRPTTRLQNCPVLQNTASSSSTKSNFSFFRKTSQVPEKHTFDPSDELAALDVTEALFPGGPANEFSPAAFKNLQINAEGTLGRFQRAYRDATQILKATKSEKNVQADELEAAQTRNEHLKLQLTEMAERATDQEKMIQAMKIELAAERQRRHEDEEARKQSIRLVTRYNGDEATSESGQPRRRKIRTSEASSLDGTDSASSVIDSVFSEPVHSNFSPATSAGVSPVMKHVAMYNHTTSPIYRPENRFSQASNDECSRCRANPSEAWAVVDMVQLESRELKKRIEQLEAAQEDALDFLSGLKV